MVNQTALNVPKNITDVSPLFDRLNTLFDFITVENELLRAAYVFGFFLFVILFIKLFFERVLKRLFKISDKDFDSNFFKKIENPLLWLVFITGLFFSGILLGLEEYFGKTYQRVYLSLLLLFLFKGIYNFVIILLKGFRNSFTKTSIGIFDEKIYPFFESILKIVFFILGLSFLLIVWHIDITPLLASAGIAGIALAFAAKDTVADVFGGISIFMDKRYRLGDYVIVDQEYRGEVIEMGLRSTKIMTRDDVMITVPNSVMAGSKIVNESGIQERLRVRLDIGVPSEADLDKIENVLMDVAKKADYVVSDPPPRVRYREFREYDVLLQLLFWIEEPKLRGRYKHYIIKDIAKRFKEEGIQLPVPISEIHLKK